MYYVETLVAYICDFKHQRNLIGSHSKCDIAQSIRESMREELKQQANGIGNTGFTCIMYLVAYICEFEYQMNVIGSHSRCDL